MTALTLGVEVQAVAEWQRTDRRALGAAESGAAGGGAGGGAQQQQRAKGGSEEEKSAGGGGVHEMRRRRRSEIERENGYDCPLMVQGQGQLEQKSALDWE